MWWKPVRSSLWYWYPNMKENSLWDFDLFFCIFLTFIFQGMALKCPRFNKGIMCVWCFFFFIIKGMDIVKFITGQIIIDLSWDFCKSRHFRLSIQLCTKLIQVMFIYLLFQWPKSYDMFICWNLKFLEKYKENYFTPTNSLK